MGSNSYLADIAKVVDSNAAEFIELANSIWERPEIRFEEFYASERQAALASQKGFEIKSNVGGLPTAFVAEARIGRQSEATPIIGFLGEYDALAGLSQNAGEIQAKPIEPGGHGHGCGHHLLGSGSLLAALATREFAAAAGIPCTVRYYGCPAEEGGSGKTFMARSGAFDDLDLAISWHPGMFTSIVTVPFLAVVQIRFRFVGRAAHAANAPHLGRSALDAVELTNVGVNYLREHMPTDARIHYAITDAGGVSPNVVQPLAEVMYVVRSPEMADADNLAERVKNVARGAALMTETFLEEKVVGGYSNFLQNTTLEHLMYRQMQAIGAPQFGEDDYRYAHDIQKSAITDDEFQQNLKMFGVAGEQRRPLHDGILPYDERTVPMAASTDVSDVSWITPTVQCWGACYAIGTPFHTWQLVTQGIAPAAYKGMLQSAKVMAATGVGAILDPDTRAKAKAELSAKRRGKSYRSPLPDDILPPVKQVATERSSPF